MILIYVAIADVAMIVGLIALAKRRKRWKYDDDTDVWDDAGEQAETFEPDDGGRGERAREIVARAYNAMSRRHVPWLWRLSAVARYDGRVDVKVAKRAANETLAELAGRYNVRPLTDALDALEAL